MNQPFTSHQYWIHVHPATCDVCVSPSIVENSGTGCEMRVTPNFVGMETSCRSMAAGPKHDTPLLFLRWYNGLVMNECLRQGFGTIRFLRAEYSRQERTAIMSQFKNWHSCRCAARRRLAFRGASATECSGLETYIGCSRFGRRGCRSL